MNLSSYWDAISLWAMHAGMPLVHVYHLVCATPFLNVAADDAQGLEKWGNVCLTPVHYLLVGNDAHKDSMSYVLEQSFNYNDEYMWHKTALCYIALPLSLTVGSLVKGISYLASDVRERHEKITNSSRLAAVKSNDAYYTQVGISLTDLTKVEVIDPPMHKRRPGEENLMPLDKKALSHVVKILKDHNILFWVDCGTCLGTYRYGGVIPWDWDIDIAILQKDFDNVRGVLTKYLDPSLYTVQDWSSRDKPKTYLKVYVRQTGLLIDIYNFAIDEKEQTIHSILSNGDCAFLPESWKIRERRFTLATSFDIVFPLKKASFDGIEVFVPRQTEKYLQQRYGDNIGPAKVYNEISGEYERDLSHPYWQRPYAH